MRRTDLDDFVPSFKPESRQQRRATWSAKNPDGRWRDFDCEDLVAEDLRSALEQTGAIRGDLEARRN
jgi:type I restriction enzyme M protein